jgi:hypothetical protein
VKTRNGKLVIRTPYPSVETTAALFGVSRQRLEELRALMNSIAGISTGPTVVKAKRRRRSVGRARATVRGRASASAR